MTHQAVSARLRVVLLTHYFHPERGAPQTRLREMVRRLSELSIDVTVVTGPPHYPGGYVPEGYSTWRPRRRIEDGIGVIRLPMVPRPNAGFRDRLIDQASFAASALSAAGLVRKSDVFLVESPPLFLGLTAALLRLATGTPYVFHVADPWPDFPIQMGALAGRTQIAAAYRLEALAYRHAAIITTVTPPLVDRLQTKPAARGKVRLLSNAVDLERFANAPDARTAKAILGWPDRFTIVYSGTVGLAQGLGTLIDAAARIPEDIDVSIRVIGDGVDAQALAGRVRSLGITRLSFEASRPSSEIPVVLAAADAILVMLRRGPLYDESLPTKLLEGLAAGRPMVVSADGYAAALVGASGAGLTSAAEDPRSLGRILASLPQLDVIAMGHHARRAAAAFDRRRAAVTLAQYLREAATRGARRRSSAE